MPERGIVCHGPAAAQLPFGQTSDEHFYKALMVPLDWEATVEPDISFAACCVAQGRSQLESRRQSSVAWLHELARRLQPVSQVARVNQRPEVRSVNPGVRLALFAVPSGACRTQMSPRRLVKRTRPEAFVGPALAGMSCWDGNAPSASSRGSS